ncbi:MAG: DUF4416 family protein [Endomicrobium sp.]|jgi:hypothetical protein|nr:DUF4416 family protein [Endomicrobium sp.]
MGIISTINPKVKLFCGLIFSNLDVQQSALIKLTECFGSIDIVSKFIKFDFTNYYNNEFGNNLIRCWISFKKLITADSIATVKILTNNIEHHLSVKGKRTINIDPGYITSASVILVTTKNFSHRIYLRDGIYGEVTMIYNNKQFTKLPWTYQDYLSEIAKKFFLTIRGFKSYE